MTLQKICPITDIEHDISYQKDTKSGFIDLSARREGAATIVFLSPFDFNASWLSAAGLTPTEGDWRNKEKVHTNCIHCEVQYIICDIGFLYSISKETCIPFIFVVRTYVPQVEMVRICFSRAGRTQTRPWSRRSAWSGAMCPVRSGPWLWEPPPVRTPRGWWSWGRWWPAAPFAPAQCREGWRRRSSWSSPRARSGGTGWPL